MSRPEKFEDLEAHAQRGNDFFTIHNVNKLLDHPAIGAIALGIKAATQQEGLEYDSAYGTITVRVPLNEDERQTALDRAQRSYDTAKEKYEAALAGGPILDAYLYAGYFSYEDGDAYKFVAEQKKLREEAAELAKFTEEVANVVQSDEEDDEPRLVSVTDGKVDNA